MEILKIIIPFFFVGIFTKTCVVCCCLFINYNDRLAGKKFRLRTVIYTLSLINYSTILQVFFIVNVQQLTNYSKLICSIKQTKHKNIHKHTYYLYFSFLYL